MARKKILIVEDDGFLRELMAEMLGREHEMVQACDGNEGFLAALAARPDAVVTDLTMPVSGLELIRGLNADASTQDIPVVIMTAHYLDDGLRKALTNEGNVRGFFRKGDDLGTLLEKVSSLFERNPADA